MFFRFFVFSTHTDISKFLYFCQSLLSCKLTPFKIIYIIFFKSLSKIVRAFSKYCSIFILIISLTFSITSCGFCLSKLMPCFIMKFPDSASLVVNSLCGSPSPASIRTGFNNDVFISFALK